MQQKKRYRASRRDPLANVKQIVHDRLYLIADSSRSMKTYRNGIRTMVEDSVFWAGIDELARAMKKLKRDYL
jgi:hypothetical protein